MTTLSYQVLLPFEDGQPDSHDHLDEFYSAYYISAQDYLSWLIMRALDSGNTYRFREDNSQPWLVSVWAEDAHKVVTELHRLYYTGEEIKTLKRWFALYDFIVPADS